MKQAAGLLTSDISTLKKAPKELEEKLASHEKLGANEEAGLPSYQTSMLEQSSLNPEERIINYRMVPTEGEVVPEQADVIFTGRD